LGSYYGTQLLWGAAEALNLAGRRGEAIAVGLEAIRMIEKTVEVSPGDSNPRLRLASWYELLGDIEAGYAADARKLKATNHAQLIDARRWYQKSLDTFRDMVERFKYPRTREQEQREAISEKLRQCETYLAE
jgi:hypothetical protein